MAQIRIELSGPTATLIIDNPGRRNAMNSAMYREVPGAVEQIMSDPDIRCVILKGSGTEAFGAGSDISEFPERRTGDKAGHYDSSEQLAWNAIESIPVPVVASIHGPCMGGGLAIALLADIRFASDDALFSVPPARLGLAYPRSATARLVHLVGPSAAKLLLFTARVVDSTEAHRMGLVDVLTEKDDLDAQTATLADQIGGLSPLSIRAGKLTVDSLLHDNLDAAAAAAASRCYSSADFREGVQAFMDKRRPIFEGR